MAKHGDVADSAPHSNLSTLVYRSQAANAFDEEDLFSLVSSAERRNHREKITGCVVYDNGRFLQWLEGPRAGLERVVNSIRADRRHENIEILKSETAATRVFSGWSMRLLARPVHKGPSRSDITSPSKRLIECLHRDPERAPGLMRLVGKPIYPSRPRPVTDVIEVDMLRRSIRTALVQNIGRESHVVPARTFREADVKKLVRASVAGDIDAASNIFRSAMADQRWPARALAAAVESAAQHFAIAWQSDSLSTIDILVALQNMSIALRRATLDLAICPPILPTRSILVVTMPGEAHLLPAIALGESLLESGFNVCSRYPASPAQLTTWANAEAFDALVICFSSVFRRDQAILELPKTIRSLKKTCLNRSMMCAAYGAGCPEHERGPSPIGLHASSQSASSLTDILLRKLAFTNRRTDEQMRSELVMRAKLILEGACAKG